MKNIIVGKNTSKGTVENDSADLQKYFELGWELMTTRLKLILMLNKKEISKSDVVVTSRDRMFMYENLFDKVVDCNNYKPTGKKIDLVANCMNIVKDQQMYKDIWKYKKDVLNINYSNFDCNEKFIGLLIRKRSHCPERNVGDDYYVKLLQELKAAKIKTFVFGMGSDRFCDNKNSVYVNKLRDWATLMHHKNCLCITGGASGALMVGQICCNNKILLIDQTKIMKRPELASRKHPLFAGRCVHFSDVPIKFYFDLPKLKEIQQDIKNYVRK